MSVRAGGFEIDAKADRTPVTDADRNAEAVILQGLEHELPGIAHVGEEEISSGRSPGELGEHFILVDPLDGTREFISGRDEFTVNIAFVRNGVPEIGVVLAPALRVGYSAAPGIAERYNVGSDGCGSDRARLAVSEPRSPPRILVSHSHRTVETDEFIARYPDAEIIPVGSSLKFCLLAEGKADLYPRFGQTMEWDTAAGDAVLRGAGGRTRAVGGELLTYGKCGMSCCADFTNPSFICDPGKTVHSASG